MSFEHLNLDERLLKAVEACGFQEPTPIQQQAIPVILDGEDLICLLYTSPSPRD